MKQTLCIILVLVLFSCNRVAPQLQTIEKIIEEYPDSALIILNFMGGNANRSEHDEALYNLFMTQAKDKCKQDISDDSLVENSAEYFSAIADSVHAARSYFYAGKVARRSGNPSLAIAHYVRAKELLKNGLEPKYQFLIRYYLAGSYYDYYMYQEGIEEYKDAYKYAKVLNDSVYQCILMSEIGFGFIASTPEMPDSTIYYEKQALNLAIKSYCTRLPFIFNMLSTAFLDKNENDSALYYCNLAIENSLTESLNLYNRKGMIFAMMNQSDSALYYSNKALCSEVESVKATAFQLQTEILKKKGDYKGALNNLEQFLLYRNAKEEALLDMYVTNTGYLVKHIQIKDENHRLYRNKKHTEKWMLIAFFGVAIAFLLCGFVYYIANINKKKKIYLQEQEIERQGAKIKEQEVKEMALRESFFRQLNLLACPVIGNKEELEKEGEEPLSIDDWSKILENANVVFDGFIDRLKKSYPLLNEKDLYYCCLLRMGLSQSEMAIVFKRKKDSVKKRLKAIRTEKIGLGENITFDEFLRNF